MINRTAFVALLLIMVVSWVFGIVCDKMLTRWLESLSKPQETPERRSCDTCKFEYSNPLESPCKECADDDIDMWQPGYITRCETCKWEDTPWDDEPCYGCSCGDRWEANR